MENPNGIRHLKRGMISRTLYSVHNSEINSRFKLSLTITLLVCAVKILSNTNQINLKLLFILSVWLTVIFCNIQTFINAARDGLDLGSKLLLNGLQIKAVIICD